MEPDIPTEIILDRAREVLGYFLRYRTAADDVEGITRWRLRAETVHRSVAEISRALEWLTEEGFLVQDRAAGVAPVFRLNQTRAADAERFLRAVPPKPLLSPVMSDRVPIGDALVPLALAWLDAALLSYHYAHPGERGDVPGLSRSPSSIERALLPAASLASPSADEARQVAEAGARALSAALARPHESTGPLASLCRLLGLTPLELQVVVLCMAPEIDLKYQLVYGVLHDDLGRRAATLGLVGALLGEPRAIRGALAASGGLQRWRLLESGAILPSGDEPLRLDPSVVAWLMGDPTALLDDSKLRGTIRRRPWSGARWVPDVAEDAIARLIRLLGGDGPGGWLALVGEDLDWWRATLEVAAERLAIPLLRVPLRAFEGVDGPDADEVGIRIARAAQLAGAIPVIDGDGAHPETCSRLLESLAAMRAPVLLAHETQPWIGPWLPRGGRLLRRDQAGADARGRVLAAAAAEVGLLVSTEDAERVMARFPLGLEGIDRAVQAAALPGPMADPSERLRAVADACRRVAAPGLPRFARRLQPTFRLEDVVLPDDRRAQLDEIVAHVVHAQTVLQGWGFGEQLPYGRGVAALFSGASGTGKTMAAQAIAQCLQTEIFVVDLSQCVSKYIGESEKNLDVVFGDAERAGAVLLFDEADALFGKRSEVKDAHDRYANIEVAYLLQRMEAYAGLAILTTNFRQNLDPAFLRRLRFVVEFPKPDPGAREEIWRKCLPADAPVGADVDVRFLARRFELTGGHIRQITLRAAFTAVSERSKTIAMRHVVSATRAELLKLGMPTAERELAELAAARWSGPRAA